MAAAQAGRRQPTIRTLWAIAKSPELGMTDEDLHAVVYRETGKASLRALTQRELGTVARVLQGMKDGAGRSAKRTDEGGRPETAALRRKLYAQCREMGRRDPERMVNALARRMFTVERQEWLTVEQCVKILEALKAMAAREEHHAQ